MSVSQGQHEALSSMQGHGVVGRAKHNRFRFRIVASSQYRYSDSEITPMSLSLLSEFMTINAALLVQYTHFNI